MFHVLFTQLNDTPTSQQANRDLLIMLDESGSVGENKFQKLKRIGAAIVKRVFCFWNYCTNIQNVAV